MPGFNQTGPSGQGPMTGRGRGPCGTGRTRFDDGYGFNAGRGIGMGFGNGFRCRAGRAGRNQLGGSMRGLYRGMGRNRWLFDDVFEEDDSKRIDRLQREADAMKRSLAAINQQLERLEKKE